MKLRIYERYGVMLGSDHAEKSAGIGPKTVLKKYKTATLTESQTNALKVFTTPYEPVVINKKSLNINELLDWLESKNFNRDRMKKQIDKVIT